MMVWCQVRPSPILFYSLSLCYKIIQIGGIIIFHPCHDFFVNVHFLAEAKVLFFMLIIHFKCVLFMLIKDNLIMLNVHFCEEFCSSVSFTIYNFEK